MGAGASTKGYTYRNAVVAELKDLADWLSKDEVKAILGDKFDEAVFDKAANGEGKVNKVPVLLSITLTSLLVHVSIAATG